MRKMTDKILFIKGSSPFKVNAVMKKLEKEWYRILPIEPDISAINEHRDEMELAVIFLGDKVFMNRDAMIYLQDVCRDKGVSLYLIGDKGDIKKYMKMIPGKAVTASFETPFDVRAFVNEVEGLNRKASEKKRILFVDDDDEYLQLVGEWLSEKYYVTMVRSGEQAMEYLDANETDLVLLDYMMPEMNGAELLGELRQNKKMTDVPVIFLTGKDDKETVVKVLELKPDGYLLKSIEKKILMKELERFFDKR